MSSFIASNVFILTLLALSSKSYAPHTYHFLVFKGLSLPPAVKNVPTSPADIGGLVFLVCVNDTWGNCMTTVKTPAIKPDTPWNKSENILVGDCDHGPLLFTASKSEREKWEVPNSCVILLSLSFFTVGDVVVDVTFYSSVIEDASHPECRINFNYQYLVPDNGGI